MTCKHSAWTLTALLMVALAGCQDLWINTIYPLGGQVPGGRGSVDVVFANETPYRAIFTFGTYDPQDQTSEPVYAQFAVDPGQDETPFNRGLGADTVTARGVFVPNCGRALSLGGEELIARIQSNETAPANGAPVIEDALRPGIYFTSAPLDDPDANGVQEFDIRVDPVGSLLGVDYSCDSLLVYTFRVDPADASRVLVSLDVVEATAE